MSLYEFIIKDKSGKKLAILDAQERSYSIYLNKSGDARFTISLTDENINDDITQLAHKELYIYRSGTLVWGGELNYKQVKLSLTEEYKKLSAKGFFDLLSKRRVGTAASPRSFTNTDLTTVLSTLLTEAQTGTNMDLGITIGAMPLTGQTITDTFTYANLKEVIEGLSNLKRENGIDFEVTPAKKIDAFYPYKGRILQTERFEWGNNIQEVELTEDATEMVNQVFVLGTGEGNNMVTVTRDAEATIQAAYKIRQGDIAHKDTTDTAVLTEYGDKYLFEHKQQQQIVGITVMGDSKPTFGSYQVGDFVPVKIKYGSLNIDGYYRIYGIVVSISDNDEETIKLIFNPD
jgi:hypothetical protein